MSSASSATLTNGPARQRPTLLWSYALLAPAMIFILTCVDRSYQTDLWHHLARGREIWQTRSIVSRDVFTYTVPGEPYVDNNWLTQVAAYGIYRFGGLDLLQTANSVLLGLTIAGVIAIGVRRGAPVRVAGLIGVIVVAGLSSTLLIRPQTLSMLLFVALLAVMLDAERKRSKLLWAPLILALWANMHGAFPIGLLLIGCFALGSCLDHLRRLPSREGATPGAMIGCLIASTLATLANPYGWHVYEYVRVTSARATARSIQEWLRPDVFTFSGGLWIVSVLAMLVLAIVGRRQVRLWLAIVVIVFAGVSCTSVRMGIWWYLGAGPMAMIIWPRRIDRPAKPSVVAGAFYAMIVAAMAICLPALEQWNPIFKYRPPDRAETTLQQLADAIADRTPTGGRIFSRLEWGEYLSYALPWKNSIFMDGRIEIYPDDLWDEYHHITTAEPDWQKLLDRHDVTVLLLDRHYHDGLIKAVSESRQWRQLTLIGGGVIYIRSPK